MLSAAKSTFRADLQDAREKMGLTRNELDDALGISHGMVARYENGDRKDSVKPGLMTLIKMNKVLFPETREDAAESVAAKKSVDVSTIPLEDLIEELKRRGAKEIVF